MSAARRHVMLTGSVLLLVIGVLGAFDIVFFHMKTARLLSRPECRREAWIHAVRGIVYAAQFVLVPNVRFSGVWVVALFVLFAVDALVAALDVLAEPASRKEQGGLPGGEYAMHVLLSVLVGAMLHSVIAEAWAWRTSPTAIAFEPHAPVALRLVLGAMALGSLGLGLLDMLALVEAALPRPRPIHVSVRIPTTVARLWEVTQDHVLHPSWDHRFDRITMLAERIETGTRMLYEKTVLGLTIRGWGRYKLHAPLRQSTFAFGSDDVRSLIEEGVGLWRYTDLGDGRVEFMTSYTYEVRWGAFGRVFDRWVFRPLFQRETERSFRRLARDHFGIEKPVVLGAHGRKPRRFAQASRTLAFATR